MNTQENLVGKINGEARTYAEAFDKAEEKIMQEIKDMEKAAALKKVADDGQKLEDVMKFLQQPAPTGLPTPMPVPSREAYSEAGKVRWTLKSVLGQLESLRFKFGPGNESRDLSIAITELENVLFRMDRVVENGNC